MKNIVLYLMLVLAAIFTAGICEAGDSGIMLNSGEGYEFTNNSGNQAVIKSGNPYISNALYDYAVYDKEGRVTDTAMAENSLAAIKVPAGGSAVVSVVSCTAPLEFWDEKGILTGKVSDKPALQRIAVKAGESYEFVNVSQLKNVIRVHPTGDSVKFDYASYNKDESLYKCGILLNYSTGIEVPAGGRLVVTADQSSKPVEFAGAFRCFQGGGSKYPALFKTTVKSGQEYEFVNKGARENSIEAHVEGIGPSSFDYVLYDKDGVEKTRKFSVSFSTSIAVPPGGRLKVKNAAYSKPVEFGGSCRFFSPEEQSTEEDTMFEYKEIDKAETSGQVVDVLSKVFSRMSEVQKQDDDMKEKTALFVEYAIEKIGTNRLENNGAVVDIDSDEAGHQVEEVRQAGAKIQKLLSDKGVELNRGLYSCVKFDLQNKGDGVSAVISKDLGKSLEGIDYIKVDTGEVSVAVKTGNIEREAGESNSFSIEINRQTMAVASENTYTGAAKAQTKKSSTSKQVQEVSVFSIAVKRGQSLINKFNKNIKLAFPVPKDSDPEYSCVFLTEDDIAEAEPVGGKYSMVRGRIEIESERTGRYFVKENKKSFVDIGSKDSAMKKAIEIMASKGIADGGNHKNFEPDVEISRAEFVKLIVRTLYSVDKDAVTGFRDIPPKAWYYYYAASSEKEGLVNGYPDNTFRGGNTISKEEIVKICAASLHEKKKYRYPERMEDYLKFKDDNKISGWVKSYLALAVREKLLAKRADGMFQGEKPMTRGEAVLMLYRLYERM